MDNIVNEELVEWISKSGNEDLLDTLKLMKEASSNGDWYDALREDEKTFIKKGLKDHQEGNTLSSKEFWNKHG